MKNQITIEGTAILRDGEQVGKLTPEGDFKPIEGLHHKTAEKIAKEIDILKDQGGQTASRSAHNQEIAGSIPATGTTHDEGLDRLEVLSKNPKFRSGTTPISGPLAAPQQDPALGDKTRAYVSWYRLNHTAKAFDAKYGNRILGGDEE